MIESQYKMYLLAVLLVGLATNNMDGLAFGLLLQDIKTDLSLSDTQLGLLTGIAFALFYSIAGIPIARLADHGNRVTIISLTAAVRSVLVASCGLAGNFVQLLLIRIGVGVGEAGCVPSSHSLIADHYTRAERPRAVAIYLQGNSLSILFGYFLAGWLNEFLGWRMTFVVLGLPGVLLAALIWTTLKDPRYPRSLGTERVVLPARSKTPNSPSDAPRLRDVCATLWRNLAFRHLIYCFSVVYFFGNGIAQWQPAFFARSYGLSSGELGTWFAAIFGLAGAAGMHLGGEWASRYAARNERLQLRAMAVAYCVYGAISTSIYLAPNHYLAFGLMGLGTLIGTLTTAPLFATIQALTPPHMRATAVAIVYLFANLVGMGLGPVAAGMLSDLLRPMLGEESLRYSLLALCPGFLWVAWHLWRASQSVERHLADVEADVDGSTPDERIRARVCAE